MFKTLKLALSLSAALISIPALAAEGSSPVTGVPRLDHVFFIMMENHGYSQIIGNPNAPFANAWAASANLGTNYFGIGHPSLNNYLEVLGGSNFGVRSDNYPDWHNTTCKPNLATGAPDLDNPNGGAVCPIAGTGTDAATPAIDCTNEYTSPACGNDIDGVKAYAADAKSPARRLRTNSPALTAVGRPIRKAFQSRDRIWSITATANTAISPTSPRSCRR
jgi:hypothetical protein